VAVIADCSGAPSVEPTTIILSCGDGNAIVNELHWTSWTATGATATGQLLTNTCTPTCAAGTFTSVPVDVVAGAVRRARGANYLSVLFTTPTTSSTSTAHALTVPR
jgi:hypothetical protein